MGNLTSLQRHGRDPLDGIFDDLSYHYRRANGKLIQNRLYQYEDLGADNAVTLGNDGIEDLPYIQLSPAFDPEHPTINDAYNYGYDQIGNLIRDDQEGIETIRWTATGKVDQVLRPSGTGLAEMDFGYDGSGQRTRKSVFDDVGALQHTQHYIGVAQARPEPAKEQHHGHLPIRPDPGHRLPLFSGRSNSEVPRSHFRSQAGSNAEAIPAVGSKAIT